LVHVSIRIGAYSSGFHSPQVGTPLRTVAPQSDAWSKQPITVISFEHESATNSAYGDDGP
jgi:hypothetical protein